VYCTPYYTCEWAELWQPSRCEWRHSKLLSHACYGVNNFSCGVIIPAEGFSGVVRLKMITSDAIMSSFKMTDILESEGYVLLTVYLSVSKIWQHRDTLMILHKKQKDNWSSGVNISRSWQGQEWNRAQRINDSQMYTSQLGLAQPLSSPRQIPQLLHFILCPSVSRTHSSILQAKTFHWLFPIFHFQVPDFSRFSRRVAILWSET